MREIKFRQANYKNETDKFSHFNYWGLDIPVNGCNSFPSSSNSAYIKTHDQFTGLHDKNGNPIYEGDIITFELFGDEEHSTMTNGTIIYEDNLAWFSIDEEFPLCAADNIKIVGNIHENPELLKP